MAEAVKIELYRPSNGTEGDGFFSAWCMRCARDKTMSEGKNYDDCGPGEVCELIGNSMAFDVDDPKYPQEWRYGANGPECTAFVPVGQDIPRERCAHTIDMFGTDIH